jgi:hypothetical protein
MLKTALKITRLSPKFTTLVVKKINPMANMLIAFSFGRVYQFSIQKRRVLSQGGL